MSACPGHAGSEPEIDRLPFKPGLFCLHSPTILSTTRVTLFTSLLGALYNTPAPLTTTELRGGRGSRDVLAAKLVIKSRQPSSVILVFASPLHRKEKRVYVP